MVTGAYYPELSGAGLQCRTLITRLKNDVDFSVLTTTTDRTLPRRDVQDGVPVRRVFVDPASWRSKAWAACAFARAFAESSRRFSIVHLHGFSQKSIVVALLARMFGKRIAIKLTSYGDDDPVSIASRGWLPAWCLRRADLFFAVSPRFRESYDRARLAPNRFRMIPNGVDLARFRPPSAGERAQLRNALGIPAGDPLVLFVGFFSREKQPDLLFEAWADMAAATGTPASLVFVGTTRSSYYEIDPQLAANIRARAESRGLSARLHFVESTTAVEQFHRAADIFALPSLREGMPNALLEAMASGAACIVTRLEGITDRIVEHGRDGLLVPAGDRAALAGALIDLTQHPERAQELGAEARRTVEARFALEHTAREYLQAYRGLLDDSPCAA
jgi:glycosyltransferase involved in cell wall biosynthesis